MEKLAQIKVTEGVQICIEPEKLPYTVMAASKKFVIASRKMNRREDADLLKREVELGAYNSFSEAYAACKENPIYCIIDLQNSVRSSDNMVFGKYDYSSKKDCRKALADLENGKLKLSERNKQKLSPNAVQVQVNIRVQVKKITRREIIVDKITTLINHDKAEITVKLPRGHRFTNETDIENGYIKSRKKQSLKNGKSN